MAHQCNLSRICTDSPRALQVVMLHSSIKHESEKHGEKHSFGFICVSLHKRSRIKRGCAVIQLLAFSTNNEVSMNHQRDVQNVHCCAPSTVVFPIGTVSVFCNPLYTVPETKRFGAQIHAICKRHKVFLTQFDLSGICTTRSRVQYCSVHETYASCSSCTFVLLQKENQKRPKDCIFSLLSVPVFRTCPIMIRISVSQLYPKLRIMHKKGRFHDTLV